MEEWCAQAIDGPNLMTQDSLPVLHNLQFLGQKI